MGFGRCKRGVRMMREIVRLKKGAVGMKTKKMKSFGECASVGDFFAQYACGEGGKEKEDPPIDLSSPSPSPNAGTSSPPPPPPPPPPLPLQQNRAKDPSSPITAAVAATTPSPPPLHQNPTDEKSIPQTPPIAPIAAADVCAQFVCEGGGGSKGNPNSKPPPPPTAAAAASNSSPQPSKQSQITNNHQKSALSVPPSTPIAPISAAHESKSMDDLLAEFVYEGKGGGDRANDLSSPIPKPPPPLNAAPAAAAAAAAASSTNRYPTSPSPPTAPPSSWVQQGPPYPMPYVVMVDGKIRVMSRFFPPPPNAIIIHVEEEEVEEVEVVVDVEVLMVPARNPARKRKGKAEEMLELDGDAENTKKRIKKKIKQRSVLTVAEKRKDCYRRVVNGSSAWVPPASPYKLLQEQHFSDPWRVVIICMLLNLTTATQVKQVLDDLFLLCPNAEVAATVSRAELRQLLKPLGLWRKRTRSIKKFSCQYLESDWTHITQLHGVGKYAADAYAIFCVGEPEEVVPEDHKLANYWRFVCVKRAIEHQQRSAGEFTEVGTSDVTVCWSESCDIHDPPVC